MEKRRKSSKISSISLNNCNITTNVAVRIRPLLAKEKGMIEVAYVNDKKVYTYLAYHTTTTSIVRTKVYHT